MSCPRQAGLMFVAGVLEDLFAEHPELSFAAHVFSHPFREQFERRPVEMLPEELFEAAELDSQLVRDLSGLVVTVFR